MEITRVNLVYFSPTQTTRKTLRAMASAFSVEVKEYDVTTNREIEIPVFGADELVIAGVPVYGGRIPLLVEPFFQGLKANGTPAAVVGVYGNRHYDDAVLELADYLREDGFVVCAGAACLAEHSFGHEIATGRPDARSSARLCARSWKLLKMPVSSLLRRSRATVLTRPEVLLPTPQLPRPLTPASSAASASRTALLASSIRQIPATSPMYPSASAASAA